MRILKEKFEVFREVNKIEARIKSLFNLEGEYAKLKNIGEKYRKILNMLFETRDRLGEVSENLFEESNTFVQYLKNLGKCPICYSKLTKEKIDEMIKV